KPARPWISQGKDKPWGQGGPLDLDARGNVKSLKDGQFAETFFFVEFGDRYPAGTYTCLYDGKGDVDVAFDATVIERQPGRLKVLVKPNNGQATVRVLRTDPTDPVRNIRILTPGSENTYREQPFRPDFLARWKGFRVFRFMDWQATNNAKVVEW